MLIPLDKKKKEDKCSFDGNRGVKIGEASFEDIFLIIPFHWASFHLFQTSISVYREDHIKKNKENNLGAGIYIVNEDIEVDNPSIGINIVDTDNTKGEINNPSTSIDKTDIDGGADKISTVINIADTDRKSWQLRHSHRYSKHRWRS